MLKAMHGENRGIEHINAYCRSQISGGLVCDVSPTKGRVLLATKKYERGTALFIEPPLLLVAETQTPAFARVQHIAQANSFLHPGLWYWAALRSLTSEDLTACTVDIPPASLEQQNRLLMLCQPEIQETSIDVSTLVSELWSGNASRRDALGHKLERLLAVWLLNCFEHSEDPVGYSIFFLPSFISHSCRPNCMWHYSGDRFVLRAREDISAKEEVTVSYLSEEALLGSTESRRRQLQVTKHFVCHCERCSLRVDRARGFSCPGCGNGEIFFDVTAAPSATHDGSCSSCGFLATSSQVKEMCQQETKIEELILDWDSKAMRASPTVYLTDAIALRLERNIQGLFSWRHWLRDRVARHLITYYETSNKADLALPLAKRCIEFITETYPGYSALHAWALETQGDLLLRLMSFSLPVPNSVEAPPNAPPDILIKASREVVPLYAEAAQILNTLFGQEHDFYVVMRDKRDALIRCTHGRGRQSIAVGRF